MGLYERCVGLSECLQADDTDRGELLPSVETGITTVPATLSHYYDNGGRYYDRHVHYVSDIHLVHKVYKKFKNGATDDEISCYVKQIAVDLINSMNKDIGIHIVMFGGDISSNFELAKLFYTEFIEQYRLRFRRRGQRYRRYEFYAVLGNHEFWDFETADDCCKAYKELFEHLGIYFLQNKILPFCLFIDEFAHPYKWVKGQKVEFTREDDPVEYDKQMRWKHGVLIVGGVGFAGCNNTFNADAGIYRGVLTREQEIEETEKWRCVYNRALDIARETDGVLVVLSHNPVSDWKPDGSYDSGCVYFSGHTHQDFLYHDEDMNIHVFANNQIGYTSLNVKFKEAYIYERANPFAYLSDGYYEITGREYLRFGDYFGEHVNGTGLIDRHIERTGSKFYMIKNSGYYGFFLVSEKGTSICAGGRVRKISKCSDIEYFNANFSNMISEYVRILSPYRNAQEQIAEAVKSFGGDGRIHGCIVDIDFFNHIMLNPSDGSVTYYYSPEFGYVKTYGNLLSLLENHNKALAVQYRKQLKSADRGLAVKSSIVDVGEMVKIDIKNSVYAVSNRMNQLQRLFDKNILRDWNDDLLIGDLADDVHALPERSNLIEQS